MCLHTDWWTIWSSHSKNSARTGKSCPPQMMQRLLYKLLKKAGAVFQIAVSRCVKHIAVEDRTTWPRVSLHVIIFVSCQYHKDNYTLRTAGLWGWKESVYLHWPGSAGRFCTGHHIGLRKSWESWRTAEDSCSPPPWNHNTCTFKTFYPTVSRLWLQSFFGFSECDGTTCSAEVKHEPQSDPNSVAQR